MKDIYELLNEINIDDIEKEEMEVSELERKRGKKKLMFSIRNKKRTSKKIAMVASLAAIIGVSSIVVAKPAWAMDIPVIGDLIQLSLVSGNSNYEDYIQAVGTTKSDQGIDITFESAIADRNVLNLEFVVKNNNESIEGNYTDALLIPTSLKVNGKNVSTGAGATYEVIDASTVRILKNISWDYGKLPSKLNIDIEIAEMFGKIGDWDVSFALDSKEIEENTYVEKLDKVINIDEIDYKITDVIMTPLTTNIEYETEYEADTVYLDFMIFDGEGNGIPQSGGGWAADDRRKISSGNLTYSNSEDTKTLNIIPFYDKGGITHEKIKEEKLPPTKINIDNFSPINLKINEDSSIDINECIIDGEFLIIDYSFKYLGKDVENLYISYIYVNVDNEGEIIPVKGLDVVQNYSEEEQEIVNKLHEKYPNNDGRIKSVIKIGNAKDIEIGCYDGSSKVILKDEAFTVTKK